MYLEEKLLKIVMYPNYFVCSYTERVNAMYTIFNRKTFKPYLKAGYFEAL